MIRNKLYRPGCQEKFTFLSIHSLFNQLRIDFEQFAGPTSYWNHMSRNKTVETLCRKANKTVSRNIRHFAPSHKESRTYGYNNQSSTIIVRTFTSKLCVVAHIYLPFYNADDQMSTNANCVYIENTFTSKGNFIGEKSRRCKIGHHDIFLQEWLAKLHTLTIIVSLKYQTIDRDISNRKEISIAFPYLVSCQKTLGCRYRQEHSVKIYCFLPVAVKFTMCWHISRCTQTDYFQNIIHIIRFQIWIIFQWQIILFTYSFI